jgi:hypothetical protein
LGWANSHPESNRFDLEHAMLEAWAGKDNLGATKMTGKSAARQFPPLSERLLPAFFRTLAMQDVGLAVGHLMAISGPNDRGQAMRGILDTVQTDGDRDRILEMISQIPDDDVRVLARRATVEQWAARDAPGAAAYVEKAQPAWERTRLMDSLGLTWLQREPEKAADWWVGHAPGPDTLVKIVNVWAQQDPNAAGRWLTKQSAGPASDAARMSFARQVADLDPESALRWAESVSDTTMRDSAAAKTFLDGSGWPLPRQARLKTENSQ